MEHWVGGSDNFPLRSAPPPCDVFAGEYLDPILGILEPSELAMFTSITPQDPIRRYVDWTNEQNLMTSLRYHHDLVLPKNIGQQLVTYRPRTDTSQVALRS